MFSVLVIRLRSLRLLRVSGIVMRLRMFLLLIPFLKSSHAFRHRNLKPERRVHQGKSQQQHHGPSAQQHNKRKRAKQAEETLSPARPADHRRDQQPEFPQAFKEEARWAESARHTAREDNGLERIP